jgi:hypothetical protein
MGIQQEKEIQEAHKRLEQEGQTEAVFCGFKFLVAMFGVACACMACALVWHLLYF